MADPILSEEGGAAVPRSATEAETLGTRSVDPAARDAATRREQTKKMFETSEDAALTFAEGIVDALSAGFIRETGDMADLRREANSGWAFAGNLAGTAGALLTGVGPAALAADAGETLGRAAAKTFLRAGDSAIATTALTEAGAGAALAGATAFGHQVMDSVIEDREFSAEAILHEAKLGGVMGGAAGALMGVFGKVARRADVEAQGGLLGDPEKVQHAVDDSVRGYDDALDHYREQYGALKGFRDMDRLGEVSDGFMDVRKAALQRAERAQAKLRELDPEGALSGADDAAHEQFRKAFHEYRKSLADLDEALKPGEGEYAAGLDLATPTVVELNPLGKHMGDLAESADRVAGYERAALEAADREAGLGGIETPSSVQNTGAATPQALAHLAPSGAKESAEALMQSLQDARAAASEATVVEDLPLGAVEGKRARMRGALQESAPLRQRAAERVAPPQPVPADTVIDALPEGAAAGALDKAAQAERTTIRPADTVYEKAPQGVPRDFRLKDWVDRSRPGRTRPIHLADARATSAWEQLRAAAGGRMESARALDLVKNPAPADDLIGHYLDQVHSIRKSAKLAADEARGVPTKLRDAMQDALKSAVGSLAISKALGSKALGLMAGFAGYGGRLASASGRLVRQATEAVARFMSPIKVRSLVVGATNYPWAYSERGPIKDPIERIQEIQMMADNPAAVAARVQETAGDLAKVSPELIQALTARTVHQMQSLKMRAPAIFFDKLGRPVSPPQGKMRDFFEYENAMNDLGSILDAISNGSLTRPQADALRDGHVSTHMKVASAFLMSPEALQALSREKLRVVEMVTGLPLTAASDPQYLLRQAQAWVPPQPPAPPQKAQALKMNPEGAPMPSSSNASGRAPGN